MEQRKKTNPFYRTSKWKAKRLEILERDNYECQWCKAEGRVTFKGAETSSGKKVILEIDHIKELDDYPELALEDSNLRTLCRNCHNKRHGRYFTKPFESKNKWKDDEKW